MYAIEYAAGVAKDLRKLPRATQLEACRIAEQVLAHNPHAGRRLTGVYKGLWKFRLGDYRLIYAIESKRLVVLVLRIRHRKEAYRHF